MVNLRDYRLPTTDRHAHIPQWMTPGVARGVDRPLCSFAGDEWRLVDGGGGKPLCHWCLNSLGWSAAWMNELLAALGEDT